ncbi:MAG: hypothetical protein ABI177_10975 [Edaphobacter sp.]
MLMIFVGMVAVALIVQAIALVVMAVGAAKARKRFMTIAEEVRAKAMPVFETTQDFIANTAPKMVTLAENLVETSSVVRSQIIALDVTLNDLNAKARMQAARADDIATTVLTGTAEAVNAIQRGINVPIREFNGLVNGLKAGLDVLVGRTKGFGSSRAHASYRESNDIDL